MSSHEASTHDHHNEEPRSKTAMSASFWFVIILVGLFIAALNFINVMGHDSGEGHATHEATTTEHHEGAGHEATHEASGAINNEAAHGEGEAAGATHDSANAEGAHHE